MKLTDKGIAALKAKPERYEVWEDGRTGLGVRVSPKGRKSWVYIYRFDGKARRMGFSTYPAVGLANARVPVFPNLISLGLRLERRDALVGELHDTVSATHRYPNSIWIAI